MAIKLILFGAIIGIANIIPGVSGGTIAVVLKIYDKLIHSVSNIKSDFKNSLKFLIPIGIGAGIGIILFSKIIEWALLYFPVATSYVFVGLIIGSIPLIFKKTNTKSIKFSEILIFIICISIMFAMDFFKDTVGAATIIDTLSVSNFIILFGASFLAAGAMIIPGISGSFILLLLGIYNSVLAAISNFNLPILIPVGIGMAYGILVCAKIIDKLFEKFPNHTYSGILGLMFGSIYVLIPPPILNFELLIGIILLIIFAYISYKFSTTK